MAAPNIRAAAPKVKSHKSRHVRGVGREDVSAPGRGALRLSSGLIVAHRGDWSCVAVVVSMGDHVTSTVCSKT